MADDEIELSADDKGGAEKNKGGKPTAKIAIIAIAGVLILSGSVGATLYLTGDSAPVKTAEPEAAPQENRGQAEANAAKGKGDPIYYPFDPPITVSLDSDESRKYLQVSISVMSRKESVVDAVRKHRPAIRNNLNLLFSEFTYADVADRGGKEKLLEAARREIANTLEANGEDSEVEAVYFTSLVID